MADKIPNDPTRRIRGRAKELTEEEQEAAAAEINRRRAEGEALVRSEADTIVAPTGSEVPRSLAPALQADARALEDRLEVIRAKQQADADTSDAPKEVKASDAATAIDQQRREILDRLAESGIVVRPVIGAEPLDKDDIADLVVELAEKEFVADVTGQAPVDVSGTAFGDLVGAADRKAVEEILTISLDDLTPVGQLIVAGQVRSGGPATSQFEDLLGDIVGGTNSTGFFKPGVIPGFGNPATSATNTGITGGTRPGTSSGTDDPGSGADAGGSPGGADETENLGGAGDRDASFGTERGFDDGGDGGVTGDQDDPEDAAPGGEGGDDTEDAGDGGVTGGQDDPEDPPPDGTGGDGSNDSEDEFPASDDEIDTSTGGADDDIDSPGSNVDDDFFEDDDDDDEPDPDDSGAAGGGVETSPAPDSDSARPKGSIEFDGIRTIIGGLTGGGDVDPVEGDGATGGEPIGPATPRRPSIVNPGTADTEPPLPSDPVRARDPGNIDPVDDDTAFGAGAKAGGGIPDGPSVAAPAAELEEALSGGPSFGAREVGIESGVSEGLELGSFGTERDDDDEFDDD